MFQAGTALRLCQALGQYLRRPCAFRQSSLNFSRSSSGSWDLPAPAVLCGWGTLSHFFPSMPFPTSVCPPLISFRRSLQIGPAAWRWRADLGWLSLIWTQDENRALGCLLPTAGPWTWARAWAWVSALTCPRFDLQHVGLASPCRGFLRPLLCNQLVELHSLREQPPHKTPIPTDTSCKFWRCSQHHPQVWSFNRRTHRIHQKLLHSQLRFITGKGSKLKSVRGEACRTGPRRGPNAEPWSPCGVTDSAASSRPQCVTIYRETADQGNSLEPLVFRVCIGAQASPAHVTDL